MMKSGSESKKIRNRFILCILLIKLRFAHEF